MPPDAHAELRPVLAGRLRAAMQSRDDVAVAALRSVLNAIDNATAVDVTQTADRPATQTEVARRIVSADELTAIIRGEADERERAAEQMDGLGQAVRAARLRAEAAIVRQALRLTDTPPA